MYVFFFHLVLVYACVNCTCTLYCITVLIALLVRTPADFSFLRNEDLYRKILSALQDGSKKENDILGPDANTVSQIPYPPQVRFSCLISFSAPFCLLNCN